MLINTKFDINQEVWFLKDGKAVNGPIYGIHAISYTYIGGGKYTQRELYDLNSWGGIRSSEQLFTTKQELLNSL